MGIIRTTNGHTYKVSNNDLAAALQEKEKWAGKLRDALRVAAAYKEGTHSQLAEEMESIEARLGNYAGGTIFDHVRSIFNDTAVRGFQHALHFPELVNQYRRYGTSKPPNQWHPPPDAQSRDPSPAAFHPSPTQSHVQTPNLPPVTTSGPAAISQPTTVRMQPQRSATQHLKGNLAAQTIARMVKFKTPPYNDHSDDVPSDAIRYEPGCSRCQGAKRECWALHKNNKKPACYGCRHLKMKCDLVDQAFDKEDDTKEAGPSNHKQKPRRKPATVVAPGAPGEYGGQSLFPPITHPLLTRGSFIPPS